MDQKRNIIKSLKEFKKEISRKVEVDRMIVFGSFTKGKFTKDSDIDLIIVSKAFRKKNFHERSLGLYKFWKLDRPFDFICLSPEEFENMRKRITIVSLAEKEGIEI
jgi:predicted nucleotidyltransferase